MPSSSLDSRRGAPRRDSSRSNSSRRPKLLRSSATEPSLSTSTASRNALATPQSSRRATDLLSQVAIISGSPPHSMYQYQSTLSPLSQSPTSVYDDNRLSSSHHEGFHGRPHLGDSGRYFSFPSFDAWDMDPPLEEEKVAEMKSP